MAIVRDATSTGSSGGTTSLTVSHTCTGSNLLLVVGVQTSPAGDTITGVTYNGVAMTRIEISSAAAAQTSYLYYLLNPATGAHDVVVSRSPSGSVEAYNVSYTGVKQVAPEASANFAILTSTTCANTLTTIADNAVHVVMYGVDAALPSSVTNGTVVSSKIAESNPLAITPAASHTMTGNGVSQNWSSCGASFAPFVVASTAPSGNFAFL